ncbi:uncharacterized protein LOC116530348 isoform X1 [Sapajus apella]|uniref:Uncharacterized protein LOC116530348 isoform X1 n=1 Tax=Sapajus apella TaxID=9515 RepID=A0A6J3FF27_SAPAP|nr:uncharacterized protein LOC116530348 isoform X1 [Sapajus apella]
MFPPHRDLCREEVTGKTPRGHPSPPSESSVPFLTLEAATGMVSNSRSRRAGKKAWSRPSGWSAKIRVMRGPKIPEDAVRGKVRRVLKTLPTTNMNPWGGEKVEEIWNKGTRLYGSHRRLSGWMILTRLLLGTDVLPGCNSSER